MCTGSQVPKTVLVKVSLVPSIFRLAHAPEFVVGSARPFVASARSFTHAMLVTL